MPSLHGRCWGTVVHVGAGLGAFDARARRLVLLDGEPAACARLRAAVRGRSDVEVHEQIVAPKAEKVTWYVHSWSAMSGLHDCASTLHHIYPRLQVLQHREEEARSLASWLEGLVLQRESGNDNALVIEVPVGADALLRSLPVSQLLNFDWIVAGGWRQSPSPELPPWLRAQDGDEDGESWAWRVWRVDAAAYENAKALDAALVELDTMRRHLEASEAQGADLAARVAEQELELAVRKSEIENLSGRLGALARAEGKLALIADLLLAERLK